MYIYTHPQPLGQTTQTPTTTASFLPRTGSRGEETATILSCLSRLIDQLPVVPMDQSKKRAREGEDQSAAAGMRRQRQTTAEVEAELANGLGGVGEDEPWQHPPGVFELPWQKGRGGLGLGSGGGLELRDVFFRSLVDGCAATIGVPGDRLNPPPSMMFDDVEAWLAGGDGGVDPLWRSVVQGPKPAA